MLPKDPVIVFPDYCLFQWAPTLGGECYPIRAVRHSLLGNPFQWAPTLGGECYFPQLGVALVARKFQWAPTLGGECYKLITLGLPGTGKTRVSMGTHPWG